MHPTNFPEANVILGKDQPEYRDLPMHRVPDDPAGQLIACWKCTWKDRLRILFTGQIWQSVYTFNRSLQPQLLGTTQTDVGMPQEITTDKEQP